MPSRAISRGNSARNQWWAKLPAARLQRSAANFFAVRCKISRHPDPAAGSALPGWAGTAGCAGTASPGGSSPRGGTLCARLGPAIVIPPSGRWTSPCWKHRGNRCFSPSGAHSASAQTIRSPPAGELFNATLTGLARSPPVPGEPPHDERRAQCCLWLARAKGTLSQRRLQAGTARSARAYGGLSVAGVYFDARGVSARTKGCISKARSRCGQRKRVPSGAGRRCSFALCRSARPLYAPVLCDLTQRRCSTLH